MKHREQPQLDNREQPRKTAWLNFGGAGHESEYVIHLEDCDADTFITPDFQKEIQAVLGQDWQVSNRGTRLEIVNDRAFGHRDDHEILRAISGVLSTRGYTIESVW